LPRLDLRCDPSAPGGARIVAGGALAGPYGAGLFLLFSERFRFVAGYDWRRIAGEWRPHPLSRRLVTGRKCIPWMHHPYVPHAILARGDECDWLMVLGTFGPRHDWGDGSEANFPQYALRKAARDRHGAIWEDGIALDLLVESEGRLLDLADLDWSFRHEPGRLELASDAGPIARIELLAPAGQCGGRVRLTRARGAALRLIARARFLARRLTVAPADHDGAIDVLDAPFGFQKFADHRLTPGARSDGVAFAVEGLPLALAFVGEPAPARVRVAPADLHSTRFAATGDGPLPPPGPCFDVELALDAGDARVVDVAFAVEDEGASARAVLAAPCDATTRALEGARGELALELDSGDRRLDALWRWSRSVAHALVAPNGVIMTGALGYSAKCHVGQDVPFVFPLFLLDPHPRLRAAADTTLRHLIESDSAHAGRGILDHPCEGRDFAFIPMRPASARWWKRFGAAGLLRWILCAERRLAAGDDELARAAFRLFAAKVAAHYLPFDPAAECWSAGEETQELAYSLPTAVAAFAALARMGRRLGCEVGLIGRLERARGAIREYLERPLADGGLRLSEPLTRGGVTLAAGWIAQRRFLDRDPPWFGFDFPLVAAHALVHEALSPEVGARLAALLADPDGDFRVKGEGLAKSPGGAKGVWFWHNGLAALGLARAGLVDAADELLTSIARGVAGINGLGIPGEEVNGGDYAMGIGALAGLCLLETLLGLTSDGAETRLRPRLPSRLDRVVLERVVLAGRPRRVEIVRRGAGPLVAATEFVVPHDRDELRFELA
jgi:hypothetical protein